MQTNALIAARQVFVRGAPRTIGRPLWPAARSGPAPGPGPFIWRRHSAAPFNGQAGANRRGRLAARPPGRPLVVAAPGASRPEAR